MKAEITEKTTPASSSTTYTLLLRHSALSPFLPPPSKVLPVERGEREVFGKQTEGH